MGVVSGVAVLRAGNIVHGDLRRENAPLDGDMTARVCRPGHRAADGGYGGWHSSGGAAGHYCAPERVARAPNVMVHPYAWTRLQRFRPRGGAAHQ
jgi:hypothetical protein